MLACHDLGGWPVNESRRGNLRVVKKIEDTPDSLYREIFDENPGLIAFSDPETGQHHDVNKSWLAALGYARDEVIGKTAAELCLWADNTQRQSLVDAILHDGSVKSFKAHFRGKDGREVHALVSGRLAMIEGQQRLLLIGQDITEEKRARNALQAAHDSLETEVLERTAMLADRLQELLKSQSALEESEKRFRGFADLASDWYWETDVEHRFAWLSQDRVGQGAANFDISLGKTRWDITREDADASKWKVHREVLDAHQPFRNFEYQARRRDGTPMWISVNGAPVIDADGNFCGYRGTASDISDRIEAQGKIQQANNAKTDFLTKMSHELRTPLNAVIGFGELLSLQAQDGEPFGVEEKGYIDHIMTSGRHLLGLVNSLLDLSKIEAGTLDLDCVEVCLNESLDECIVLLGGQAKEAGISLNVQCRCDASKPIVIADSLRLRQVLLNLISNAIKYNKPNGEVNVECQISPCGRYGRTFVSDTGHGIPDAFQDKLFTPFSRADSVIGSVEGTGIGLAITRQLVGRMGGQIDFDSHEGMGTTFWVDFPLA